jgi:hypothetical protein
MEDHAEYVTRLAKKIAHFQRAKEETAYGFHPSHYQSEVLAVDRQRSKTKGRLTEEQLIDICQKVLIEGEFQKCVAKEFRVTQGALSNVVRRLQKDPDLFNKLKKKREEKDEKKNAVMRTVHLMNAQRMPIESC